MLVTGAVDASCSALTPGAQSADMKAMAQQFGQSAKANAAALRMYSWQMRVEVTLKGDTKPAKLFAMRFDASGVIQKTPLNPAPPAAADRGLKGKIKEKKIAEFKEWAGDLVDLCKGYLVPSPALLQAFFAKVLTAPAPGGFVQLYADRRHLAWRQAHLRDRSEDPGHQPRAVPRHARRRSRSTAPSSSPTCRAAGPATPRRRWSTRRPRS